MLKAFLCITFIICSSFCGYSITPGNNIINEVDTLPYHPILTLKGMMVFDGKRWLGSHEVMDILESTPAFASQYHKGLRTRRVGLSLMVCGALITDMGIELATTDYPIEKGVEGFNLIDGIGVFVGVVGVCVFGGGCTCARIGKLKAISSVNGYNEAMKPAVNEAVSYYMQVGLLDNGRVGIRINF